MALLVLHAGCFVAPVEPPDLAFRVTPIAEGADIAVEVRGGPRSTAWVAFGATPLSATGVWRRIDRLGASSSAGPLPVVPAGASAWRVDVGGADTWTLEYRLVLGDPAPDIYHRVSSRSQDHLLLIGADAFPRLFASSRGLGVPADQLPPSETGVVTVEFDAAALPRGWRVASASPEVAPNVFRLDEEPDLTVFAVGPYRLEDLRRNAGIRLAVHEGWSLAASTLSNTASQLVRVMVAELGNPPGDGAILLCTPLPRGARPAAGVRTAGMAWNRSLVLFGGAAEGLRVPAGNREIREMVAVFLGHELFHLYVPWGIRITQDLSWLSEGWASHVGRRMALSARLLGRGGFESSLRRAYDGYIGMGGYRAGNLTDASQGGDKERELLYARGDLVFRIMSLEWETQGRPLSFDATLWTRLLALYDGSTPLEPDEVFGALASMIDPATVERFVEGTGRITLADLELR